MHTIGFKQKKSKNYFADNEFSPTKIYKCQSYENDRVELERLPYFRMNFELTRGYKINSGFECMLDDVDTGMSYQLANQDIINLFVKIQNGQVTVNTETQTMSAIFSVQKKGSEMFAIVPTEEELLDMRMEQ